MIYLDKKGDIEKMEITPSTCIINNTTAIIPKFSFIIPTYKRADLLRFAIESCLQQDLGEDFEILIVDDNPERDDETEKLIKKYFNIPGIIYYKNQVNVKQEGNWNKLFLYARTEWIIMLHDDDMLYPDYGIYLKQIMNLYKSYDGFFPSFIEFQSSSNLLPNRKEVHITTRVIKMSDFLQGCILGAPVGMCIRRSNALKIGGVSTQAGVAVDYDFYARFAKTGKIVKMYGYPLGVWRIMRNVSLKLDTVLYCVKYGDALKRDTLEYLNLLWLSPLYEHYIKGFDNQHVSSWYISMNKETTNLNNIPCAKIIDQIIYKLFRYYFALRRRLRIENRTIKIKK